MVKENLFQCNIFCLNNFLVYSKVYHFLNIWERRLNKTTKQFRIYYGEFLNLKRVRKVQNVSNFVTRNKKTEQDVSRTNVSEGYFSL